MVEFTIDLHNYPEGGSVFRRTAVRAIVQRDGRYLLVTEKYGDYKFPGGGAEPGETLEETLVREVLEETGYTVKEGSLQKWGVVKELRKGKTADILEMDSHYFFCEVEGPAVEQDLDEYEKEYLFRPEWVTLTEALEQNLRAEAEQLARRAQGTDPIPWVTRDRKVMERLLEDGCHD